MIPELGHFALVLALVLGLVLAVLPLVGAQRGISTWIALARPAAQSQLLLIAFSYACLTAAFLGSDFSVAYVANHSNSQLPLIYRISGVWGGHEGSLLLWVLILSLWMGAVTVFSRSIPDPMTARVLAVMGMISVGFLLFMIFTSNPFERMFPVPREGRDLNPLLQDIGLAVHPPMLYLGYVGFSVVFSFAIAAMIQGRFDAAWARWSRPWTNAAWMFLTVGIALGSWWAYYELGWGGWWFWDPVENASFMPWLIGTALIHSLAATEKRGVFKAWTILLAVLAFSLSLLGTFLVRSGVLVSVHAFATDPSRGVFILIFLGLVIGGSLLLYAWRVPGIISHVTFSPLSREGALLLNNVFLGVLCFSVLLGTLYPLILDALNLGKISVGPPYFDLVFSIIGIPMTVLIGVGALLRWKKDRFSRVHTTVWSLGAASLAAGGLVPAMMPFYSAAAGLGVAAGSFVVLLSVWGVLDRTRRGQRRAGLSATPGWFYGMTCAHIGVGMFIVGVTLTTVYNVERDVRLGKNESYVIHDYEFVFRGTSGGDGPNYRYIRGQFDVYRENHLVTRLFPEKRTYLVQQNPMTEAAISPGWARDLYVALGEPLDDRDTWAVRIYYKPFIRWIWAGALAMALGGLIGAADRRYRRKQSSMQAAGSPGTA
ncbi:MAG: heme lyase CcmF/NrfE family subunit [Gammaproteobacteria bacterium]|nr:heme lyase CcmF/NrfE family subunit [Gammaproteobacteria bacterium]